jgi:predicted nucleic acid-binding protein
MMMRVAIDTVVLAALVDTRDKWHATAVTLRDALKAEHAEVSYFDPVLAETISLLARRLAEQKRLDQFSGGLDKLDLLVPLELITWVSPETPRLYPQILALVRADGGELNFNDALIALACQELGVQFIASFDRDFDRVDWLVRLETPDDVRAAARS